MHVMFAFCSLDDATTSRLLFGVASLPTYILFRALEAASYGHFR